MVYIFTLFYFFGLVVFFFNYYDLLVSLISIEFVFLVVYMFFFFFFVFFSWDFFLIVFYLIFGVVEGSLGLIVLVVMVRVYGNDYLLGLVSLQC